MTFAKQATATLEARMVEETKRFARPSWALTSDGSRYVPVRRDNLAAFRDRQHQRMKAAKWPLPKEG